MWDAWHRVSCMCLGSLDSPLSQTNPKHKPERLCSMNPCLELAERKFWYWQVSFSRPWTECVHLSKVGSVGIRQLSNRELLRSCTQECEPWLLFFSKTWGKFNFPQLQEMSQPLDCKAFWQSCYHFPCWKLGHYTVRNVRVI